jgi:hypothetical protein
MISYISKKKVWDHDPLFQHGWQRYSRQMRLLVISLHHTMANCSLLHLFLIFWLTVEIFDYSFSFISFFHLPFFCHKTVKFVWLELDMLVTHKPGSASKKMCLRYLTRESCGPSFHIKKWSIFLRKKDFISFFLFTVRIWRFFL